MRKTYYSFGFCASLERRVDEIKNSKSEIILKLPHLLFTHYHRIFNFSGTPYCTYIIYIMLYALRCRGRKYGIYVWLSKEAVKKVKV